MTLIYKILTLLVFLFLFFVVLPDILIAIILYLKLMVRTSKKKWTRECSEVKDKEQVAMFEAGLEWEKDYEPYRHDVSVTNDGYSLYGEYFDYGFDKAVIIISGRSEGCRYSYYYAKPYRDAGYNVLVIDNRCHGLSGGKLLTFGLKEYTDILTWGKLLNEQYGVKNIVLHGICIGAATALYALVSDNAPSYFGGMIADGMYTTYYDSFKNHIVDRKHKTFPVLQEVFFLIKTISKVDAIHYGPVYCIDKLTKPVLFIHSKKDRFSLPEEMEVLYEKCTAPKKLVWFEEGAHSHIRIRNEEAYDRAISDFVGNLAF